MIADEFQKAPDQQTARVVLILDESQSMEASKDITIDTFNAYLKGLAENPGRTLVTVWKFDAVEPGKADAFQMDRAKIVPRIRQLFTDREASQAQISRETYQPFGWTPLYDAVGTVVSLLPDDKPTLCVVMTDGQENSSKEWLAEAVQRLIRQREAKGWTFVFLGADLTKTQSDHIAGVMGMSSSNSMAYDKRNTVAMGATMSASTARYSQSGRNTTRSFLADDEQEITASRVEKPKRKYTDVFGKDKS